MNIERMSNEELLIFLVGKRRAKTLAGTPLAALFSASAEMQSDRTALLAARELVTRYLYEQLVRGPSLTSPRDVREYLVTHFAGHERESFVAIFVDTRNRLIAAETLFQGTLSQTAVYPREVVRRALAHNAAGVILAHNHPSGLPDPSNADQFLTQSLKQALSVVDVAVLDHFIVAGSACTSFAERGLI